METTKKGLVRRVYLVLTVLYFLLVGFYGVSNYLYQDSVVSSVRYDTIFVDYVALTPEEKERIKNQDSPKLDECKDKVEINNDVFCLLDLADEANYKKTPNILVVFILLVFPFVVWFTLKGIRRLGLWVLTGK